MTLLAVDVGRGTQDILVHEPERPLESSCQLVLPSPTVIVATRIQAATARREDIFLRGHCMGGGSNVAAIARHLRAGLKVYATEAAARTIHDNPARVREMGIQVVDHPPDSAAVIHMTDYMEPELRATFEAFGMRYPEHLAFAVQDHGYSPDRSNRIFRFEMFLRSLEAGDWNLFSLVHDPPLPEMTRMQSVREQAAGALVIDTGPAALIGALSDPVIGDRANGGLTLVNAGNGHTLCFTLKGEEVHGLFEHHTAALDRSSLIRFIRKLQEGSLGNEEIFGEGGHGVAIRKPLESDFIAVTGPNRKRLLPDAYQAAPHGNMMLTGCFGLLSAWERVRGPLDGSQAAP
ncbi:MAG: DUF1786 domain-containing protein [Methanomicrobiales archaeon]|nr:DUF1786 domain-containing protein [Methanomicrobiales archaeon]